MPDCEENLKGIYHHATMTEAMIDSTFNKDREIVISKDFDPFMFEEFDSCEGNNYILSFEFCDPDNNYIKTRRNFVSYEGLSSVAGYITSAPNYICSGTSLVNINSHANYYVISGDNGWSIQKALEELDAAVNISSGSGLIYLKDGPTDGSLKRSDGTSDAIIDGDAEHQINLMNAGSTMDDSPNSTAFGQGSSITNTEYAFATGDGHTLINEAFGLIGSGLLNNISDSYASLIMAGRSNYVTEADYASILNGLENKTKKSLTTIVNGRYAGGETHAETIFNAERTNAENTAFSQYSTVVLNGITTDDTTPQVLYLSDDIDAELITAPEKGNLDIDKDGGAISGKIILTGLHAPFTDNAATVRSNYLFSVVKRSGGLAVADLVDLSEKTQNKVGTSINNIDGALSIGIASVGGTDNKVTFSVTSDVDDDVLWTASICYNRQVKDTVELTSTTTTTTTTTTPAPTTTAPVAPNCLTYYRGNSNILDSTGNFTAVNNGTGFTTGNPVMGGQAFSFGGNDWLQLNNGPIAAKNTDNTFCFWFRPSLVSNQTMYSESSGISSIELLMDIFSGKARLVEVYGGFQVLSSTRTLSVNTWYFVACTRNTTTGERKIYLAEDGVDSVTVLEGSTTFPTGIISGGVNNTTLGATSTSGNNPYDGRIDEFVIFDEVLTKTQIDNLYNSTASYCPSPTTTLP